MTSLSVMPPTPDCRTCTRDFVGAELGQRALDRFGRTLHVGLEDQRQQPLFAASRVLSN